MADIEKIIQGLGCCLIADCTMNCPYTTIPECSEKLMTDALSMLKEQEPQGWISVKDQVPEHSGWYLVSLVNNHNGHRWKTPVVCEYSFDVWHENDLFSNDVDATVTHWAYLPEPPEEVSGDD